MEVFQKVDVAVRAFVYDPVFRKDRFVAPFFGGAVCGKHVGQEIERLDRTQPVSFVGIGDQRKPLFAWRDGLGRHGDPQVAFAARKNVIARNGDPAGKLHVDEMLAFVATRDEGTQ